MSDIETLRELLEEVEAATGPDRALDNALMSIRYIRGSRNIGLTEDSGPNGAWVPVPSDVWIDPATDKWVSTCAMEFTGSIDAAVGLVEGVLPGWGHMICRNSCQGWLARVEDNESDFKGSTGKWWDSSCSTAGLSIMSATLKALIWQKEVA